LDRFPSHPLPTCVQCFARKLVGSFDECWEKICAFFCFAMLPLYFVLVHLSLIFSLFVSSDILLSAICSDNGAAWSLQAHGIETLVP
jgi:hypothetical protein